LLCVWHRCDGDPDCRDHCVELGGHA
jgi:hypothetical protein